VRGMHAMEVPKSALKQPSIHEMKEWELTDVICQLPLKPI